MIESQRQLFKNKGNNNFNYEFECINNHSFDFLKNENNIIHREKDRDQSTEINSLHIYPQFCCGMYFEEFIFV